MPGIYEFAPVLTAPTVRAQLARFGAPQIVHIPTTPIPSPLAPNLAPQTVKKLKEHLTGCGPDGIPKPGNERGVEIWESWKRAWDLWNNHYIEGRVDPAYILQEYNRIKQLMDEENDRKQRRRPRGPDPTGGRKPPTPVQLVYSRVFSRNKPTGTLPPGRIWVKHRYRTGTIKEKTGRQIQRNNPNPGSTIRRVNRIVKKTVLQKQGETVKIYRKAPKDVPGIETRIVRANGPWDPNLTSWATVRTQRLGGNLATPQDTETTAEPMEPTASRTETRHVRVTEKHLDYVDLTVSKSPKPLMSWADIATARRAGGIPANIRGQGEYVYERSRPQVWVANDYDLVDNGATEVLNDERRAEVLVTVSVTETVLSNPVELVDEMRDAKVRQWLEIDDPNFKQLITPASSKQPSPDPDGNKPPPSPPAPVIPRSSPLDSFVLGNKDTPRYGEWEADLLTRWNAVNPRRLAPDDPDYITWRARQVARVAQQWEALTKPGSFLPPTHSNGNPGFEDFAHSHDEDMADVSDQESQDAFDEDEYMEDDYEQRALAPGDLTGDLPDPTNGENGDDNDDNGGGSGSDSDSSSDSSSSNSRPPVDLGPPARGQDGSAGGFLPMRLFPEYREPVLDANGDYPDTWTDNIQNTVWRPRRVGEKTLKIDIDEPWENITDLEVDGGLDCGRTPYPVFRSINKYIRNQLSLAEERVSFRKEKVWDGVTGSLFNMPTRPDEADGKMLDDREGRVKTLFDELDINPRPRHDLFPLDIRRIKKIDPTTNRPYESEVKVALLPGESEADFDLPWNNPIRRYPDLKETDPWWVTPEQERLRDVPPRRHPPADDGRVGDQFLPLDDYRWKQERLLDESNRANYYVTNLHGGTILINGAEVKLGCIAGPLPDFAVIETPGGQVSFWWGVGGRDWGGGAPNANFANNWRQLRRTPGWENVGVNAGVVWNRKIRDRLEREKSGNDEEDDEQWEEWKNPTPAPSTPPTTGSVGSSLGGSGKAKDGENEEGRNTGPYNNDQPAKKVHEQLEICYEGKIRPASSLNAFKPPDVFETEEVELQWLHTRAQPLREAIVGAVSASKQAVAQLKALSTLIAPDPDRYWPGNNQPVLPEITAQQQADNDWPQIKMQAFNNQLALVNRLSTRRADEEAAKNTAYRNNNAAATQKRQLEQSERDDQTRRTRKKLEQEIRNAQANYIQTQATSAATKQTQMAKETRDKLVQEEAANLSRLIGLNVANPTLAQLNTAGDARKAQRTQELTRRAAKLTKSNAARTAQGLPPIVAQPQLSAADFNGIITDAIQLLNPAQTAADAAAAQAVKDAEDQKIKAAIIARAAQDLLDRQQAKQNAPAAPTLPQSAKDHEVEERRKRYQAATFRRDAQAQRDAEDQRKTAAARRAPPVRKPAPFSQATTLSTTKTNTSPPQLSPKPGSTSPKPPRPPTAQLLRLRDAADVERAMRANRLPLVTPPTMNAAERKVYDDAVAQRAALEKQWRTHAATIAKLHDMTEDAWVLATTGYRDLDDWIESFDFDNVVRLAMPKPVAPLAPTGRPGDSPPAGTVRTPDLRISIPAVRPTGNTPVTNEWASLMRQMGEAVEQGLEARAALEGIPVWQAAHRRGWWSLQAMKDGEMNKISFYDCPEYTKALDPQIKDSDIAAATRRVYAKILNANDWEAVSQLSNRRNPTADPDNAGWAKV